LGLCQRKMNERCEPFSRLVGGVLVGVDGVTAALRLNTARNPDSYPIELI
jgi:hypothetical protein